MKQKNMDVRVYGGDDQYTSENIYVDGKVDIIKGIDPNKLSLLELDDIAEKLGYALYLAFYYKFLVVIWPMEYFVYPVGLPEQGKNNPMGSGDTDSEIDSEYVEEENQTGSESTEYENVVDDMECSIMIMWMWKFNDPVLINKRDIKGI
ncbi:unnamed protein product [Ilex paraguariensis]|uniref:PB1-like domain-containing protein n=1 Tax=Ilex paraguariensis TaxID=185542 RepID=A0ABC8TFF9_9AQUA